MAHPLHTLVGKEFEKFFNAKNRYKLLLDPACGGNQNIPFFFDKTKPKRAVWLTNVDVMVAEGNKVKLVCEIEESNVKPGHIFGKFLSLVSSGLCILNNKKEYYFDDKLIFIQVLSIEKLKPNSKKRLQWSNIEKSLSNNIKAFGNLKSLKYHIVFGDDDTVIINKLNSILSNI